MQAERMSFSAVSLALSEARWLQVLCLFFPSQVIWAGMPDRRATTTVPQSQASEPWHPSCSFYSLQLLWCQLAFHRSSHPTASAPCCQRSREQFPHLLLSL